MVILLGEDDAAYRVPTFWVIVPRDQFVPSVVWIDDFATDGFTAVS